MKFFTILLLIVMAMMFAPAPAAFAVPGDDDPIDWPVPPGVQEAWEAKMEYIASVQAILTASLIPLIAVEYDEQTFILTNVPSGAFPESDYQNYLDWLAETYPGIPILGD